MITGLQKYAGHKVRQRGSSPKFQSLTTSIVSAQSQYNFQDAQIDRNFWGRLTETAMGAHLINESLSSNIEIFYWREGQYEVDFVLRKGKTLIALEVKSGRRRETLPGMEMFKKKFKPSKMLLVGSGGMPIDEFLKTPVDQLF
jgi:predicted AAA+ superfamily ATPase